MSEQDEGQREDLVSKLLEDQDAKSMLAEGIFALIKPALLAEVQEQVRKEAEEIVPALLGRVSATRAAQGPRDVEYSGDGGDEGDEDEESYEGSGGRWSGQGTGHYEGEGSDPGYEGDGDEHQPGSDLFARRRRRRTPEQQAASDSLRALRARMRPIPDGSSEAKGFDRGTGEPKVTKVTVKGRHAALRGTSLHRVTRVAVDDVDVPDFVLVSQRRIEFEVPPGTSSGACVAVDSSVEPTEAIELGICTTTGEEY